MRTLFLSLIHLYQRFVSPALPPACRFEPTCSEYAHESIRQHGTYRGLAMSLWRVLRCQPFHPGGHDPVK